MRKVSGCVFLTVSLLAYGVIVTLPLSDISIGEAAALTTGLIVAGASCYGIPGTLNGREAGKLPDDGILRYLSPLGWEHINLTGDYVWRQSRNVEEGRFRSLRTGGNP